MKLSLNPDVEAGVVSGARGGSNLNAWCILEPLASAVDRSVLQKIQVERIAYHSTAVTPGTLFFCLPGRKKDGHAYAREAVSRGAAAVVASRPLEVSVPLIRVEDTRLALSLAAARFFNFPCERINLIGVTGTNGKTTTTYFLQSIYNEADRPSAVLGSNGLVFNGLKRSFQLTTPLSLELHESLALLKEHGVDTVAMEVSSHALMQHRVTHCFFNSAVITNITRDHLDYHHTMERYLAAKSRLFSLLKQSAGAGVILNADDRYFTDLVQRVQGKQQFLYGINNPLAAVRAVNIASGPGGDYRFDLTGWDSPLFISLKLAGLFNVYNALAAAAVAWKDGLEGEVVEKGLNNLFNVPGRLEEIAAESGFTVVVDYAHTPDGLEQVLKLLRYRRPKRVITVFGCPGERDRGKRPLMGRIAERYSDLVVVTADNPAGEEAACIIQEIRQGMQSEPTLIKDRRTAVLYALEQAGPGDIVLLAGKGAEEYQLIGDEAVPYNERKVVEDYLVKSTQ